MNELKVIYKGIATILVSPIFSFEDTIIDWIYRIHFDYEVHRLSADLFSDFFDYKSPNFSVKFSICDNTDDDTGEIVSNSVFVKNAFYFGRSVEEVEEKMKLFLEKDSKIPILEIYEYSISNTHLIANKNADFFKFLTKKEKVKDLYEKLLNFEDFVFEFEVFDISINSDSEIFKEISGESLDELQRKTKKLVIYMKEKEKNVNE